MYFIFLCDIRTSTKTSLEIQCLSKLINIMHKHKLETLKERRENQFLETFQVDYT